MPRTAVITGRGVVSPFGAGVQAFWSGLVAGQTAIGPITGFAAADLQPNAAAEVRVPRFEHPDRAGGFALHAAREALGEAGLVTDGVGVGVALGTTLAGMAIFEAWDGAAIAGIERVPYYAPAVTLATELGCTGPVATPQLACASGTHALALATEWIRDGQADVVLAGGTDLLCRFVVSGFNCLRATALVARPFDAEREGLVLGEGAAIVVIEEAGHATARGARPLARLVGVGASADATHMTAPDRDGRGATRAIEAALADARVPPSAVDYVSAHGTGTVYNDAMEAVAIARVFGPDAVAVSGIKGAIGHTLGAAGALEAVLCTQVLETDVVPPTAGLRELAADCRGLDVVRGDARPHATHVAVSTSSGFAGANAALVLAEA